MSPPPPPPPPKQQPQPVSSSSSTSPPNSNNNNNNSGNDATHVAVVGGTKPKQGTFTLHAPTPPAPVPVTAPTTAPTPAPASAPQVPAPPATNVVVMPQVQQKQPESTQPPTSTTSSSSKPATTLPSTYAPEFHTTLSQMLDPISRSDAYVTFFRSLEYKCLRLIIKRETAGSTTSAAVANTIATTTATTADVALRVQFVLDARVVVVAPPNVPVIRSIYIKMKNLYESHLWGVEEMAEIADGLVIILNQFKEEEESMVERFTQEQATPFSLDLEHLSPLMKLLRLRERQTQGFETVDRARGEEPINLFDTDKDGNRDRSGAGAVGAGVGTGSGGGHGTGIGSNTLPTINKLRDRASNATSPTLPTVAAVPLDKDMPLSLAARESTHLFEPNDELEQLQFLEPMMGSEFNNVIAFTDKVWLQVDPVPDRILMKLSPITEAQFAEVLTSVSAGIFVMTKTHVVWGGIDKDHQNMLNEGIMSGRDPVYEAGVAIKFIEIDQYYVGKMDVKKMDRAGRQEDVFYIAVATTEMFKFFPFVKSELVKFVSLLADMTGKQPQKESAQIRSILSYTVESQRKRALAKLMRDPNPWIDRISELTTAIQELTRGSKSQNIYELERLYQSCRIEQLVAYEAIRELRKVWCETNSLSVQFNVVSIFDRLLDRTVMKSGDRTFKLATKWLDMMHITLDPYRNAELLRLVNQLSKRAEMIKSEPLIPIAQRQIDVLFEHVEEYKEYFHHYNDDVVIPVTARESIHMGEE